MRQQLKTGRGYLYNVETNELYYNNNAYADKQNSCVIIRSRENLIERYGLSGMITIAEKFNLELKDTWTSDDLSKALWDLFKEITYGQKEEKRRLKKEAAREAARASRGDSDSVPVRRGRTRRARNYRVHFEKISEQLRPLSGTKLPHQAEAMLDGLRSQSSELLTEVELKDYIFQLANTGRLTGHRGQPLKQCPWRIWQYYEDKIHRAGLVTREFIYEP